MEKGIVAGALFLATFLSPAPSQNQKQPPKTQPSEENIYVVQKGDSLASIALKEYGDSDFWTNLWNDNPWIKDSSEIEETWKLKIDTKKTDKPEPLNEKLLKTQMANNVLVAQTTVNKQASAPAITMPTPQAQVVAQTPTSGSLTEEQINFLGNCESGMTAARNSGNGFYGAFQFSTGTWNSMGTGYERADLAPIEVQKDAVQRLVARSNIFGQFPGCSSRMRSLGLL